MFELLTKCCALIFFGLAGYCAFWFCVGFFGHLWSVFRAWRAMKRKQEFFEWLDDLDMPIDGLEELEPEMTDDEALSLIDPVLKASKEADQPSDEDVHRWIDGGPKS